MEVLWEPLDTQAILGPYLLRVSATRSSHRWRWSVIPVKEIDRYGRAWFMSPKGSSKADARGHSATRENAEADAILMAKMLIEDDAKRKTSKKGKKEKKW